MDAEQTVSSAGLKITQSAADKVLDILREDGNPSAMLRVYIEGGGCSGFRYGFTIDYLAGEDDLRFEVSGVPVLVDALSSGYMQGAVIDYREDIRGAEFVITNSNAVTTCGCGASFSL